MRRFALLLPARCISVRRVEIDHHFLSNLLIDDLLDVGIVSVVLILLKELHTQFDYFIYKLGCISSTAL